MPSITHESASFDLQLADECAAAFSESSGLGCTVSDVSGRILSEHGYGCASCAVCETASLDKTGCVRVHAYGMTEAERFGGKYIYYCPMGLNCFVSPILGSEGGAAKITAGPFLMVDLDDYISFDLKESLKLDNETIARVVDALGRVPQVPPGKVNSLSILLFMAVGFMNNVSAANRMLDARDSGDIQGRITEYILALKGAEEPPAYPMDTERKLLSSIAAADRPKAQKLLNELLGYILFSSGGDFSRIKSRLYELLVLISRAAVEAGTPPDKTFEQNHGFFERAKSANGIDELCYLLTGVMNRYMDDLFDISDVRRVDVIHKAVQFMRRNCDRKLALEEVARIVYLSPSHFSKVFKKETGCNFNAYLNRLRVEHCKRLLAGENLRLADIAVMAGFEDQSYFTKVFKRVTGMSPKRYREKIITRV